MNLSRKWLNEFVTVDANDKEFSESMTLSGSKVEITEDLGAEISNVVVGKLLSMERHPDSDHMWVCQVEVGKDEPIQIVTGAWNIHPGDLFPVALHKSTSTWQTHIWSESGWRSNVRSLPTTTLLISAPRSSVTSTLEPERVMDSANSLSLASTETNSLSHFLLKFIFTALLS